MERTIKKIGLVNLLVLLAAGVASAGLARYSNSLSGQAGIIFLGIGFLVVAIAYFQMRMEETERLEKLEFDELNKSAASASLFNTADAEVFPARRSREQFERYFVPAFTIFLFLLECAGTYYLWNWLSKLTVTPIQQPTVAMSLFGLFALALFLLGKYSVGLARLEGARLLRPVASYMLLGAYVCFVVTVCIAAAELGFPRVDFFAAEVLASVLGLVAVETLINLILEIYRPRVAGKVGRLLYDSRLVGLLAEPEGLFTTAAQALDYQFGFKVSETWVYRFLEKAFVWLVLLQLAVLVLSTSFVFISPGEQGVLERFGSPLAANAILEPGLHIKMPWPADKIYRYRTREIQRVDVGFTPGEDEANEKAVLWTVKHYKDEANWLVANRDNRGNAEQRDPNDRGVPADLIDISVPVHYRIQDLHAWAYNNTEPGKLLERIATREVVRYLAASDFSELMSTGRSQAAEQLRTRIQAQADDAGLGASIVLVGLQDLHPPGKVAPKFEEVVATAQENEAKINQAKGYTFTTIAQAEADGQHTLYRMQTYSNQTVSAATAISGQFANQMTAYRASPRVYKERSYLAALERGLTNSRKYVLATTNREDLLQYNLEDKIRGDLINELTAPAKK